MADTRLLIADDHPLIREGLELALRNSLQGLIIDSVGSIGEAEAVIGRHPGGYRLVLLDLVLPDARGFSGFLRLQHLLGQAPIVLISGNQRPELISAARALGAAAYLPKTQRLDELVGSLRRVLGGERVFPATADSRATSVARERLSELSGAQLRVMLALADGRLNKQIAGDLNVTEATVKAHMTAIFRKLGVNNRTQAILAMQPLLGEQAPAEGL